MDNENQKEAKGHAGDSLKKSSEQPEEWTTGKKIAAWAWHELTQDDGFFATDVLADRIDAAIAAKAAGQVGDCALDGLILPERDQTKPTEEQGVFRKFAVRRVDGSDQPGGKHHGCEYFVLDTDHDQHAKPALAAYAASCMVSHPELSRDMVERYGLKQTTRATPEMASRNEMFKRLLKLGVPINTLIGATRSAENLDKYLDVPKEWVDSLLAHAEEAKVAWEGIVELFESAAPNGERAFDENALVAKALDMYGMIDTEQMYRTIKAMRELKMSLHGATTQIEGGE